MNKTNKTLYKLRKKRNHYISRHNWPEALEIIGQMISLEPSASSYTRRGMIWLKLKNFAQGFNDLHKALEIDPGYKKAKEMLLRFKATSEQTILAETQMVEDITQAIDITEIIPPETNFPHIMAPNTIIANKENNDITVLEDSSGMADIFSAQDTSHNSGITLQDDQLPTDATLVDTPMTTDVFDLGTRHKFLWEVDDVILETYKVTGELGEGGFGKVYRVQHLEWDMSLAVKSPKGGLLNNKTHRENFIREAETWVNLGAYPHIVSCYYVRSIGGAPRVFVEYVEGGSLSQWIRKGKLYEGGKQESFKRILDIAIQIAWGLHYAHAQGLVHQDVKPGNVMMSSSGMAKVTDFGLARAREVVEDNEEISQDIFVSVGGMTLAYCSIEQADKKPLTHKSDLWSWGLLVLEMFSQKIFWMAGSLAFEALSTFVSKKNASEKRPVMPQELIELLYQCFENEPKKRPKSLRYIANVLQDIYQKNTGEKYERIEPQSANWLADGLNNRAISLLDLGQFEEAKKLLNRALEAEAHHAQAIYNRGLLLWREGQITYENLIQKLHAAQTAHPGHWENDYLTGWVFIERGKAQLATEALQKARQHLRGNLGAKAIEKAEKLILPGYILQKTLSGHTQWVYDVAISKDNKKAISACWDHTLRVWDIESGECLKTLQGAEIPFKIALSEKHSLVITASGNGTLRIWDIESGELSVLEGHKQCIRDLVEDEEQIFTASDDGTVRIWDLVSKKCSMVLEGHKNKVFSVAKLNSKQIVSGSNDGTLRVWDLSLGECVEEWKAHERDITALTTTPDGSLIISGSWDKTLRVWETKNWQCLSTLSGHSDKISCLETTLDNSLAISGSWDMTLRVWELKTGRCLQVVQSGHGQGIHGITLGQSGLVISASGDKTLRVWKISESLPRAPFVIIPPRKSEEIINNQMLFECKIAKAKHAMDEKKWDIAIAHLQAARSIPGYDCATRCLDLWDQASPYALRSSLHGAWEKGVLEGHKKQINTCAICKDSTWAISASDDGTLRVWDLHLQQNLKTLSGHESYITSVAISSNKKTAISADFSGLIKIWDLQKDSCLSTLSEDKAILTMAITSCSRLMVSAGVNQIVKIREVATGKLISTLEGHTEQINQLAIFEDGRLVVSASIDPTLCLWDVENSLCLGILKGHSNRVLSVDINITQNIAISASRDHTLRVWDLATGECLKTLVKHSSWVHTVALSKDGKIALSAGRDNIVCIWDIKTGKCLGVLEGHQNTILSLAIAEDAKTAISAGKDQNIKIWHLDWNLIPQKTVEWDERVRPFLKTFLHCCVPVFQKESISKNAKSFCESRFNGLLLQLRLHGYGWISPQGIKQQLLYMAQNWKKPEVAILDKKTFEEDQINRQEYLQLLIQFEDLYQQQKWPEALDKIKQARKTPGYKFSKKSLYNWQRISKYTTRGKLENSWLEKVLEGHTATVCDVKINKSVTTIFSSSGDKTIKIWDIDSGRLIKSLTGHQAVINRMCLSNDEKLLFSSSADKTLRVWDIDSGKCVRVIEGHQGEVYGVVISNDDRLIFTGSHTNLCVWEVKTGCLLRKFKKHSGWVLGVAISPDGRFAASGGFDKMIYLWDVPGNRLLRPLKGHDGWVMGIAITHDGKKVISCSSDQTLRIWDAQNGQCLHILEGHEGWVWHVYITLDNRLAISIGQGKKVMIWDINTGERLHEFQVHEERVMGVTLTPLANMAVTCSGDLTIKIWHLDWELIARPSTAWDEKAKSYLEMFLSCQTPYDPETLICQGSPKWDANDFDNLILTLQQSGYGWLTRQGVEQKLLEMMQNSP